MGKTEPIFQGQIEGFKEKEDAPGGMAVDWFEGKMKNLYFISHAHGDHIKGLFSHKNEFYNQLKSRPHARIYCTKVTKEIISRLPIAKDNPDVMNELKNHLIILESNEKKKIYFSVFGKPTQKWIQVRTIPANHIPGAVMFLFEDGEKRALYTCTGDIRYDVREKNDEMTVLKEFVEGYDEVIDYLYVDVTCLDLGRLYHPDQNVLPSRPESTNRIRQLINDKKPRNVHIDATPLGAEGMIKEVAKILKSPRDSIIDKDSPRKELYIYMLNDLPNTYSDTSEIGLHIFDKRTPKFKCALCDEIENKLRIRASLEWIVEEPTGKYSHSDRTTWINEREHKNGDYWQVVNSHHSSDYELREFIFHFQFKKVFPISECFSRQYFKGIYYKDVTGPETNSEKKHRHIKKSLYFSLESASMKYNDESANVLWLTGNRESDDRVYMPDDKFHVTERYIRDYDNFILEVKKYSQPIDFLIIQCTIELEQSLGNLYCNLFRFLDNLKKEIVAKSKNFDETINAVLFYSTTNNMNDKWKQIINSSRLYRDKKVPRAFYIDLTEVPEYTNSDTPLTFESIIILETLKNLIRNEDKEVFVSDWPMPYEFSERKREYDQENQDRARKPASQEVEMVYTEEVNNNIGEAGEAANERYEPQQSQGREASDYNSMDFDSFDF